MSFGWGAGDIVLAAQLAKEVYEAFTESADEFHEFAVWLRSLIAYLRLMPISSITGNPDPDHVFMFGLTYTPKELDQLKDITEPLKTSLDALHGTVNAYMRLDGKPEGTSLLDWAKRQGKKLKWTFLDKEDVSLQRQRVSEYRSMLQGVVSHDSYRTLYAAISAMSDRTDANARSQMNVISDTNRKVSSDPMLIAKLSTAAEGIVLANGELPDTQINSNSQHQNGEDKAREALKLLERRAPAAVFRTNHKVDVGFRISHRTRDIIQKWLDDEPGRSCLWVQNDKAVHLSKALVAVRRELSLPVVYYHCARLDGNGNILDAEEILERLSCSFLHQLLTLVIDKQLPMPHTVDLGIYHRLDGQVDNILTVLGLARSLIDSNSPRLVWVIEDFEWLESRLLPTSNTQRKALERLLDLIGVASSPQSVVPTSLARRCFIASSARSRLLVEESSKGRVHMYAPGNYNDPERFCLLDEMRGMMLGEKY